MDLSMKRIFSAISALSMLAGCATSAPKEKTMVVVPSTQYQIKNLGTNFDQFWRKAKALSFEEQVKVWNEVVEHPYQAFYDGMVWQKEDNPKWEERKLRRLKEFFPKYQKLHDEMMSEFNSFDATLGKQISRFKEFFSDASFSLPIYAAPTTTFNGKGGEGGDSADPLGKTVLAFGIDMIVDRHDNPDVLYSHELFHIYHTDAAGVNEKVFLTEGRLTLPLWLEGLATYVSQQMNPNAPIDDILMDHDLPKVGEKEIRDLAVRFLKEANEKAFDTKNPETYKKWFAVDPQYNLGKGLPQRCGYLLGWKVAAQIAKKYPLSQMVHWRVAEAHEHVIVTLKDMTKNAKRVAAIN